MTGLLGLTRLPCTSRPRYLIAVAFALALPGCASLAPDSKQETITRFDLARSEIRVFIDTVVTDDRVNTGRRFLTEHKDLLDQIGREYGVPPEYLVAILGIETNYGQSTGP